MSALPAESGFTCLLRAISRSQDVIEAATLHRARCGRRRAYMSELDALAYERGFDNWPNSPTPFTGPEADGWGDREQMDSDIQDDLREMMAEEREARQ